MMKIIPSHITLSMLVVAISSCAVGPNFQRPAAPKAQSFIVDELPVKTASAQGLGGDAQYFMQGQGVQAQWWKAFGSPALDHLVEAALKENPDLQAAEAALRAAHETAAAQRGSFWPSVEAGVNSTREVAEVDTLPYTLQTGQLSIGYVPDVFGGNRRQVEALSAELEAQHFERQAVYMTLISNVVNTAIEEASLRAQIATTRDLIALETQLLSMTRRQQQIGHLSQADVAMQEASLAQAQVALPELEKQLSAQRNKLAALAGRFPSEQITEQFELKTLTLPVELPISLPSHLVEQRPDIRAAEALLHAASAQVGVATAARFPSITLSANLSSSGAVLSELFNTGSSVWAVGGDLLQPIFQGGTLKHQQRAAQAAYEQAEAEYRSAVLTAFQDTADTLQAIVSDAETLRAASAAEGATQKSLEIVRRQHALGAASQTDLIVAQQAHQEAAIALVQAQASRFTNTVALYQALGGWWQTPDANSEQTM